jgi:hypothetical protein
MSQLFPELARLDEKDAVDPGVAVTGSGQVRAAFAEDLGIDVERVRSVRLKKGGVISEMPPRDIAR